MRHHLGPWVAAIGLALAMISMAAGGLWAIHSQRTVNQRLCTQTVESRLALRTTWLSAMTLTLAAQTTPEAKLRISAFYATVLRGIPSLECVDRKPVEVKA